MTCRHVLARVVRERCYSGAVSRDENRAAHGGICQVLECAKCGATRLVNRNGGHVERGPWFAPAKDGAA